MKHEEYKPHMQVYLNKYFVIIDVVKNSYTWFFFHFKTIYMVCIFKAINLKMNILQYITRVTT